MTRTILNMDSNNAQAMLVAFPDHSTFRLIDTKVDGVNRESTLQKVSGSTDHPTTVRIGYYPKAEGNGGYGQVNVSVRIDTVLEDDSFTPAEHKPVSCTLAMTIPGRSIEAADIDYLIHHVFGWMYNGTATGSATSVADGKRDWLDALEFGVTGYDLSLAQARTA